MRIGLVPIPILLLGILLLTGCGAAKETDLERLVPAGATLIGKIKVAELLKDADVAALFESIPKGDDDPETLDDALDQVAEEAGVDIRQFSSVVFFGVLSRVAEGGIPGTLIARGSFDEDELVAAIEEAADLSLVTSEYKGYKIHVDKEEDNAISALGDDVLVVGDTSNVRSVIDVREGDKERASGRVHDAFNGLGDVLVRVALELPPEATEGAGLPFGNLPVDVGFVRDIEVVAVAADNDGGTLKLDLRGDFSSEESARDAGDALDALLKLARVATEDQQTRRLLDRVKVSTAGKRLTASLDVEGEELTELMGGLEEGLPGLLFGIQQEEIVIEAPRPEIRAIPSLATAVPTPAPREPSALTGKRVPEMDSPHIPVGEIATYSTIPPTSGPHWPATAQCGFYDEELPDELVTHNLEHGNVVISHNLSDPAEVGRLNAVVARMVLSGDWGVVRRYSKIEPGSVALTAWGVIDQFRGVDPGRIQAFFEAHAHSGFSPELISCR